MYRRQLWAVFLLCVAGSLVSAVCAVRRAPRSALSVEPPMVDLGILRQEESRHTIFNLVNRSADFIDIKGMISSCGCTVARPKKTVLEPGETTEVGLTMSTGASRGALAAQVLVLYQPRSEDTTYKRRMRLTATIDPEYDLTPSRLEFDSSGPHTKYIDVESDFVEDLAIKRVATTKACYSARIVSPDQHEENQRIRVEFHPGRYSPDAGRADLIVFTNSGRVPTTRVALRYTPNE